MSEVSGAGAFGRRTVRSTVVFGRELQAGLRMSALHGAYLDTRRERGLGPCAARVRLPKRKKAASNGMRPLTGTSGQPAEA